MKCVLLCYIIPGLVGTSPGQNRHHENLDGRDVVRGRVRVAPPPKIYKCRKLSDIYSLVKISFEYFEVINKNKFIML